MERKRLCLPRVIPKLSCATLVATGSSRDEQPNGSRMLGDGPATVPGREGLTEVRIDLLQGLARGHLLLLGLLGRGNVVPV